MLGFDTERSTDHGCGSTSPCVRHRQAGGAAGAGADRRRDPAALPRVAHSIRMGRITPRSWVEVFTSTVVAEHLGCDPRPRRPRRNRSCFPGELLLEVVGDGLFHDDVEFTHVVARSTCVVPDDVWLWLLACQWQRIGQEERRRTHRGGRGRARVVGARGTTRPRSDAAVLPDRAPIRAVLEVVRHHVSTSTRRVKSVRCSRPASWVGPTKRSLTGTTLSGVIRVSRAHLAALLWTAVSGDLRRAVRGHVPRRVEDPWLRSLPAHRRDRPVVRLDRCALAPAILRHAAAMYGEPNVPRIGAPSHLTPSSPVTVRRLDGVPS